VILFALIGLVGIGVFFAWFRGPTLVVGESRSVDLVEGRTTEIKLRLPRGSVAKVTATQWECDIVIHAQGDGIDHGGFGRETAFVTNDRSPDASADWVTLILGLKYEGTSAKHHSQVHLEWVRPLDPNVRAALDAQKTEARGRAIAAKRTPESLTEGTRLLAEAIALWQSAGDHEAEAKCRHHYGQALERQGRYAEANVQYGDAIRAVDQDLPARLEIRKSWENLGGWLSETRATKADLERALLEAKDLKDRRWIAVCLQALAGHINKEGSDPERSIALLGEAAHLHRELGYKFDEIGNLLSIVTVHVKHREFTKALSAYEAAQRLSHQVSDPNMELDVLSTGDYLYGSMHDNIKHAEVLAETRKLHAARGDLSAYAAITDGLASAEARLGRSQEAWDLLLDVRKAMLRLKVLNQQHASAAFSPTGNGVRAVADDMPRADAASSFWFVDSGRGLFLAGDDANRVSKLQRSISIDTLVLEYVAPKLEGTSLTTWALTGNSARVYRAPAGTNIVDLAKRVAERCSRPMNGSSENIESDRASLAERLLAPLRDFPAIKRLVIVQDGAFYRVPFTALPDPIHGGLLGDSFIVSEAPSAQAVIAMREKSERRPEKPSIEFAIVADPVMNRYDTRHRDHLPLPSESTSGSSPADWEKSTRAAGVFDPATGFNRLPHAQKERERILRITGEHKTFDASGFEATGANAARALAQSRYVHFVTHGVADLSVPNRSGLALSLWDSRGQPTNGFWSFDAITQAHSKAELVSLGACETAVGREGQSIETAFGIPSLSHAFLRAGVKRVVSTLWKVDDAASTALMVEFYRILFQEKQKDPAVALWRAQLHVAKQPQWSDPYYWAGFVLVGDWNPL